MNSNLSLMLDILEKYVIDELERSVNDTNDCFYERHGKRCVIGQFLHEQGYPFVSELEGFIASYLGDSSHEINQYFTGIDDYTIETIQKCHDYFTPVSFKTLHQLLGDESPEWLVNHVVE